MILIGVKCFSFLFIADDDELVRQIEAGREKREKDFADLMASLENKYATPSKKRKIAIENGESTQKKKGTAANGKKSKEEAATPKRATRSSNRK